MQTGAGRRLQVPYRLQLCVQSRCTVQSGAMHVRESCCYSSVADCAGCKPRPSPVAHMEYNFTHVEKIRSSIKYCMHLFIGLEHIIKNVARVRGPQARTQRGCTFSCSSNVRPTSPSLIPSWIHSCLVGTDGSLDAEPALGT